MCKKIRTFYSYNHNRGGKASHENRGRASRRSRQLEMLGAAPSQVDLQRAVPVGPSRAALAVAAHALAAMRALVRAERRRAVLPSEPLVASAPGVGAESVSAARVGAEKPLAARPGPSGVTQARPLVVARTAAVHLTAAQALGALPPPRRRVLGDGAVDPLVSLGADAAHLEEMGHLAQAVPAALHAAGSGARAAALSAVAAREAHRTLAVAIDTPAIGRRAATRADVDGAVLAAPAGGAHAPVGVMGGAAGGAHAPAVDALAAPLPAVAVAWARRLRAERRGVPDVALALAAVAHAVAQAVAAAVATLLGEGIVRVRAR